LAVGIKKQPGNRKAPAIINRAYGRSFFWDGRISSLEEQVLQPIQNPKEMAAELTTVLAMLKNDAVYRSLFSNVFGSSPEARWLSYALASYVRTLLSGNSPSDRYEAGEKTALTSQQQKGMRLFRGKARCATCHSGSNYTDEEFHNTGVAWNGHSRDQAPLDPGRLLLTGQPRDEGKFKTHTLRNIELTAPYMHDGSFKSLEEVLNFYDGGGYPNPGLDTDIRPLHLTLDEKAALRLFLKALTGDGLRK
jgi:cytochrome c peroxidase